jgi:glycosyltransferase involved in cell wall biosynthesis
MTSTALISVLMPAYNAERYIGDAIQSMIDQTHTHWELFIINDGSQDRTGEIALEFQDPRIHVHHFKKNVGLISALNFGLSLCKSDYIARMDADDISHPERLERQLSHLEQHPEIDLVGTGVTFFEEDSNHRVTWKRNHFHPENQDQILAQMTFHSALGHGTILMRKRVADAFASLYDPNYPHAEDYELWTRLLLRGFHLHNLQTCLYQVRTHAASVSRRETIMQKETTCRVRAVWRKKLKLPEDSELAQIHHQVSAHRFTVTPDFLKKAEVCLLELIEANRSFGMVPDSIFRNAVQSYWYATCSHLWGLGLKSWTTYLRSPVNQESAMHWHSLRILLKTLILPLVRRSEDQ